MGKTPSPGNRAPKPSRRAAWIHEDEAPPPLAALFASGKERQRFIRYWVRDNIGNAGDVTLHYGLKLLPMDAVSAIGAELGRLTFARWRRMAAERARRNLELLRPDLDAAAREAMLDRNWAHQGRLMTEFSVLGRVARSRERVTCRGLMHLRETAGLGAVILAGLHLGNWELAAPIFASQGVHPHAIVVPPRERGRAWIARRVRARNGIRPLPLGRDAVRPMLKALRAGEPVSLFCDEGFRGAIRGPFFGRPPHLEGNLALAVRLAHMTGAPILPFYVLREGEALRFTFRALPPLHFERGTGDGQANLLHDVARLNATIEPLVRDNIEQWYFLDNRLEHR